MDITPPVVAVIASRFRDAKKPKINQAQMAEAMGYGRSWASKLMKGKIKQLGDDDAMKLQTFLGVKLLPSIAPGDGTPLLAQKLGERMKTSDPLSKIVAALLEMEEPKVIQGPKWIATQDMTRIGQEIIKICFANEDKPGKVARMVLELLA